MKKGTMVALILVLGLNPWAQDRGQGQAVDIEVPVRVLQGDTFVDDLTSQDFEIFEDGERQEIRSLYLVRNSRLQRQEGATWSTPNTSRRFFMLFQCTDYNPKLAEAVDHFFQNIIRPDDTLTVMTPLNHYNLTQEALQGNPPDKLSQDLQNLLRRDTKMGAREYNDLLRDLKMIVRSIASASGATTVMSEFESSSLGSELGLDVQLPRYKEALQRLDELRMVNEKKILDFAGEMKRLEGQKIVFLFYQREFRPEIETRILNVLVSQNQDQFNVLSSVEDLFTLYSRDNTFNMELLSRAFADAGILFHFMFMHKEPENIRGVVMREQSEDVFNAFSKVAEATGGIVDNSTNPAVGFRNAADACAEYYLLVYRRENYPRDGQFRTIDVKVKGQDFKATHRGGYIAR